MPYTGPSSVTCTFDSARAERTCINESTTTVDRWRSAADFVAESRLFGRTFQISPSKRKAGSASESGIDFEYDSLGRLTTERPRNGSERFVYDRWDDLQRPIGGNVLNDPRDQPLPVTVAFDEGARTITRTVMRTPKDPNRVTKTFDLNGELIAMHGSPQPRGTYVWTVLATAEACSSVITGR